LDQLGGFEMSVECRVLTGLTLELERDIQSFEKLHELEEKYPELDEYTYHRDDREGKLLLIYDGMCSEFARLIMVDKYIDGGSLGDSNEFFELNMPSGVLNQELISKMSETYKEYTGEYPKNTDFKYALWSQWY
jgi:hypothetical protein